MELYDRAEPTFIKNSLYVGTGIAFLFSLVLYIVCLDTGASLWDCPEYILTAYRLEVGHPPGNPTWQLIAGVASRLAPSPEWVAVAVNLVSAIATGAACMLLFQITFFLLAYSLFRRQSRWNTLCNTAVSLGGTLCFAWCDSVIFSAVEAEVYALSIFFTALLIWLMLKWAQSWRSDNRPKARRLLILTAYVAGLSLGVHELNLLAFTAMALIYVFAKNRRPCALKAWGAVFLSFLLIAFLLLGLLPWLISLGVYAFIPLIVFALLPLAAALLKLRPRWVTAAWSLLFFTVGLATYLIIPIRAAANPPVNQGNPSTAESFYSYFKREQYGRKPLFYGHTPYSRPLWLEEVDSMGNYSYREFYRKDGEVTLTPELDMWFPRMTSHDPLDIECYAQWAGMTPDMMVETEVSEAVDSAGNPVGKYNAEAGGRRKSTAYRPTYWQQFRYMAGYQLGYMYFRYLLWNFSGRQNNVPSTGEIEHGNFITGFAAIDNPMLGDQNKLPYELREGNRGYNRYFLLPFIVGILGAVGFTLFGGRCRRASAVVLALFLMTGVAIAFYLNQDPGEPRERDYAFLGSYMAFAIWIAFGLAVIIRSLKSFCLRYLRKWSLCVVAVVALALPALILSQTLNDHYRRGRDTALSIARNLLHSLDRDAILFVDGDNLVFPLWYAQEVMGERRDVTVVAVSYLSTSWYPAQLSVGGENSRSVPMTSTEKKTGRVDRMHDIVKANAASGAPRPIYVHNTLKKEYQDALEARGVKSVPTLFTRKIVTQNDSVTAAAGLAEGYRSAKLLISGGDDTKGYYPEPYVANSMVQQRRDVIFLASRLIDSGQPEKGREVLLRALRLWGFDDIPSRRYSSDDEIFDEARMAFDLLRATDEKATPGDGGDEIISFLNEYIDRREREYRDYYRALPEGRRSAVTKENSLFAPPE